MVTTRLSAAIAASAGLAVSSAALAQYSQDFESTAVGSLPTAWSSNAVGAGAAWTVANTSAHGGSNSVFTNDVGSASVQTLDLPPFIATGAVTLDLWRNYTTETNWDGWIVETSINGSAFANIGTGAWTLNGYNGAINAGSANPLQGQQAFTGAAAAWTQSTASIATSNGDSLAIRIRMGSDGSVASAGVWLDDISVSNVTVAPTGGCCLADTTCTITSAAGCTGAGGTYRGNGSNCAAACPLPPNTWVEQSDAADMPGTAQVTSGSGALTTILGSIGTEDADMYQIQVCDFTSFSASTVNASTTIDTQMFLFTSDGHGVVMNDDNSANPVIRQSRIDNTGLSANGTYYLALSTYNKDPQDSSNQLLWINDFYLVHAPDGPGAANAIASWTQGAGATGAYRIDLTGSCFAQGGTPTCYANCDHSTTVPFLNVQDFSCFLAKFASADPYANCDNSTTIPILNVQDFSCFLTKFATGCSAP